MIKHYGPNFFAGDMFDKTTDGTSSVVYRGNFSVTQLSCSFPTTERITLGEEVFDADQTSIGEIVSAELCGDVIKAVIELNDYGIQSCSQTLQIKLRIK
jgi:hypothetical protein